MCGIQFNGIELTAVVLQEIGGFRFIRVPSARPFFHAPAGSTNINLGLTLPFTDFEPVYSGLIGRWVYGERKVNIT